MRIIAGTHRGRRFLPPKDEKTTRPITDRVKQSLFDRLWSLGALPDSPAPPPDAPPEVSPEVPPEASPEVSPEVPLDVSQEVEQADADAPGPLCVLDIFCGTGSLGLEALSRGAEHCAFVDQDREAVDRLDQNLDDLDLIGRARIVKASALNPIWLTQVAPGSIGLIFLDPPYALSEDDQGRQDLAGLSADLAKIAAPGCFLTLRTATETPPLDLPDGWDGPTSHAYGSMTLHFYEARQS